MTQIIIKNPIEKRKEISIQELEEGQALMVTTSSSSHHLKYKDLLLNTSRGVILLDGTNRTWTHKNVMSVRGYLVQKINIDYEI